jgi:acyl dehydratase
MARYLEDFKAGDRYETASIELTEEMIFQFAGQYDPQPFHLSREAAQNSLFKGLAASGWHVAALTMGLVVRAGLDVANGLIGIDVSLHWPRPTRPGDILHATIDILEVNASHHHPGWGIVKMRWTTANQKNETLAEIVSDCWVQARTAGS